MGCNEDIGRDDGSHGGEYLSHGVSREKRAMQRSFLSWTIGFHELLYEAGGSKELMRVLKDYHEYVGRVRKVTLGETKRAKNSTHEHKQICEAIKNHDALLAEKMRQRA